MTTAGGGGTGGADVNVNVNLENGVSATTYMSLKSPPVLNNDTDYEMWKKELALWEICCNYEKKKQGPAVALSLRGSAKEAALEMEVSVLNSDNGLTELLAVLDGLYLKDENQRKYVSLKALEQFKRGSSQSLDSYINDFERLHSKVKAHKILLPDSYIAYRLLESANLDQSKSELVRATIQDLTFKDMKVQLRKLEDIVLKESAEVQEPLNENREEIFFNNSNSRSTRGTGSFRGNPRGGSRGGFRGGRQGRNRGQRGRGSRSRRERVICYECDEAGHYSTECPRKLQFAENEYPDTALCDTSEEVEDIKLTL